MRRSLLTGLLAVAGVVVLLGSWSRPALADWNPLSIFNLGEKVGVVEVTGLISKATSTLEELKNSGMITAFGPSWSGSTPREARWVRPRRSWKKSTRPRR